MKVEKYQQDKIKLMTGEVFETIDNEATLKELIDCLIYAYDELVDDMESEKEKYKCELARLRGEDEWYD